MIAKSNPIQHISPASNLPKKHPAIPEEFVRKFKELEPYNREVESFWYDAISVLQSELEDIRSELNTAKNEIARLTPVT
jgi:hypothetical protein